MSVSQKDVFLALCKSAVGQASSEALTQIHEYIRQEIVASIKIYHPKPATPRKTKTISHVALASFIKVPGGTVSASKPSST